MCVVSLTPKVLLTQNARRRNVLTRVAACFKASQSVRIWVIVCIASCIYLPHRPHLASLCIDLSIVTAYIQIRPNIQCHNRLRHICTHSNYVR